MTTAHTATPWEVIDNGSNESFDIDALDSHGRWVTLATANQADAKFIVRAVNAHDDLVKALQESRNLLTTIEMRGFPQGLPDIGLRDAVDNIDAALAKAEVK